MIAAGIVGAFAVLLGLTAWRRVAAGRMEQRSMDSYERALGRLGDVARRSDTTAPVNAPSPQDLARPHVSREAASEWPRAVSAEPALEPRVRLTPPVPPGVPTERPLVFADDPELLDPGARQVEEESVRSHRARPRGAGRRPRRSPRPTLPAERARARHAASGAVAVVALAAIALGSWQLSVHSGTGRRPTGGAPSGPPQRSRGHSARSTPTTTATPSNPNAYVPLATTASQVTFQAPSGSYTVRFTATQSCWLGVRASANGTYLWMDTLAAGATTTYQGNGSLVIRIGNPPGLTMTINGEPVELPSGNVQPYDAVFTLSTNSSSNGTSD